MHYGRIGGTNGISFSHDPNGHVFVPAALQWVQLSNSVRREQLNDGTWKRWAGGVGLDKQYPYDQSFATNDSPAVSLWSGITKKTVADNYQMWLMFKPFQGDATDPDHLVSTWVPLKVTPWSWRGQARREGTTWVPDGEASLYSPPAQPAETTTYPMWTLNSSGPHAVDANGIAIYYNE